MNDKCAGGTGAVIDKINAKLRIPADQLCDMGYDGIKLHPVAGKCGVFAETDINGLQKMGVPPDELMASLFEAIVRQNLSVLTRGNTLRPHVLLLGGPNTYINGMRDCWQHNIPMIWEERKTELPEGVDPKELISVPDNAQYFAALGAVEFGKSEDEDVGTYRGTENLAGTSTSAASRRSRPRAARAWRRTRTSSRPSRSATACRSSSRRRSPPGEVVEAFVGLDGGSTSTKAVLHGQGPQRPRQDLPALQGQPDRGHDGGARRPASSRSLDQGATLKILGVGTTGYAKDILKDVLAADVALVETVAHTESALHFYHDMDVICDVGGQDIKIIILKNGQVKDFKLNTQCSAGNGYFLQSTAQGFGFPVEEYADIAFAAEAMPIFGYGCAVFMQSDIVDFQRQGWKPQEIMAGLAAVLPKNIWLYVSQIPNLASLGTNFVLQGGTQHNLAAVKSQVDFIESRFDGKDATADVIVHEHCGESGAIGAALEAGRLWENGRETHLHRPGGRARHLVHHAPQRGHALLLLQEQVPAHLHRRDRGGLGDRRLRAAVEDRAQAGRAAADHRQLCEKGTVEDIDEMRVIKKGIDSNKKANPNFVEIAAEAVWRSMSPPNVADPPAKRAITKAQKARNEALERREELRIGIPRVLNMYSVNPLFSGYFESLGIPPRTSSTRTTPPRSCTRRAPSAARSTPASRRSSASRTCTTCSTRRTRRSRSTSSSSR